MKINNKVLKLVAVVCAGLLLIIAVEWAIAKYSESRLLNSIKSSALSHASNDPLPVVDLGAKPEESYVELVSRPLFLKGRKPVEEVTAENEKEHAGNQTLDWRLDGIYTGKNGLSALLSRSKDGSVTPAQMAATGSPPASGLKSKADNYRKVSENDDIDGWRLTQIKTDRVIFEMGGETKELVLRKPKPKELPPEKIRKNRDQNRGLHSQNSHENSRRPQARTRDMEQRDEASRQQTDTGQPVDSESESALDESENSENE